MGIRRFGGVLERGDPLVLIFLKVAVGQISVVLCSSFFVNFFLDVLRLGLCEIPEKYLKTTTLGSTRMISSVAGALTVVKIWDRLEDVTVGVECLWPTDSTRRVPMRVQDDFGVDEVTG